MENELQKTEATAIQPIDPASPAGLMMQLMSDGGGDKFDVEGFGKMLEFQAKHEDRQAKKAYHVAMAEFQADAPKIIKQSEGHNCKYAKLPEIVSVVAPKLSEHGLSHSWVTETSDKEIKVTCKITHILGHSEKTSLSAGADKTGSKNDIQALGSTVTYLERYTLKAALGLAEADQDDDGNAAGKKPTGVMPPEDEEQEAIDAICAKIPAPDGKRVDAKKVAAICYEKEQSYPDPEMIDRVVAWFAKFDRPEIFIPENRSDFEIGQDMAGDEDSTPDTPEEATAQSKFGEEVIECRYLCNGCSEEFEEFKLQGVCPNSNCLGRDIIDRRKS